MFRASEQSPELALGSTRQAGGQRISNAGADDGIRSGRLAAAGFFSNVVLLDFDDRLREARSSEIVAIVRVPDVAAASRSMAIQGAGRGIVAGDWNVCPGSPGSGLAGVESGPYELGEALPKQPGTVSGVNVQFDPRDFGTLGEIQQNWPGHDEFPQNKGAYFPAGNTWQNEVDARPHGAVTTGFAAVEIAPRNGDPEEVCRRWVNGLGAEGSIDPARPNTLQLAGGQTMRFMKPDPGGRTGVVAVDLWAAAGVRRKFDSVDICGVKWTLVDRD